MNYTNSSNIVFIYDIYPIIQPYLDILGKYFTAITCRSAYKGEKRPISICYWAASTGSLSCLKYAVESGGWFNEDVSVAAICSGSVECLKYLHQIGCRISLQTYLIAFKERQVQCIEFILSIFPYGAYHEGEYKAKLKLMRNANKLANDGAKKIFKKFI